MLAAVVKVSGILDPERFIADMEASFRHKFATKPQVIEGNLECLRESMKQVKGGAARSSSTACSSGAAEKEGQA